MPHQTNLTLPTILPPHLIPFIFLNRLQPQHLINPLPRKYLLSEIVIKHYRRKLNPHPLTFQSINRLEHLEKLIVGDFFTIGGLSFEDLEDLGESDG